MSAKIIPFRIGVNPEVYRTAIFSHADNALMDAPTIEATLSELARELGLDVFHRDGTLNHNALARELSQRSGKTVHQPFVTRLLNGQLKGKPDTLQPIASAFGMSVNELLARIRPDTAAAPVRSLPPEAVELWELWSQLPRQLRNLFTEQIKNAISFKRQHPELSAALTGEALQAANGARIERQRKRKSG